MERSDASNAPGLSVNYYFTLFIQDLLGYMYMQRHTQFLFFLKYSNQHIKFQVLLLPYSNEMCSLRKKFKLAEKQIRQL